jgi:hypothetical protein
MQARWTMDDGANNFRFLITGPLAANFWVRTQFVYPDFQRSIHYRFITIY